MRDFLLKTLLRNTTALIYICSLVNEKGQKDGPTERHILTRDLEHIEQFVTQWDKPGRGTFFSVSTLKPNSRRVKSNAVEMVFYHVDLDFKSIDLTIDEAIEALKNCTHPPTIINSSGHGLHAYWMLVAPIPSDDAAEETLKQAARVFAGDKQVAQRVALMRLPGTHNTKNGEWLDVTTIFENDNYVYHSADLAEWFANAEIIIKRKGTVEDFKPEPLNPFAQYAEQYGFKAPIDVEKRLAEMEYQGPGDTAIHATQVAVTASMLSAGVALEEVVEKVLAATKAVAPDNWDWKAEEKTIRGMCKGWARKLQKKEEQVSNVVSINEARAARQRPTDDEEEGEEPKGKPKKGIIHKVLSNGFLESLKRRGWGILRTGEETWQCRNGIWKVLTPGQTKDWLEGEIETGCRALGIVSTGKVIEEARKDIMRNPDIKKDSVNWDAHGKIATKSGLIDPVTLEIEELKPEHYVTVYIDCEYDPKSTCPNWVLSLADMFPNDQATIDAVQEVAGMGLIANRVREMRYALVFVGPSRSGKSGVIDVLSGLFTNTPITTLLSDLDTSFGLMNFLDSAPWVLHEAFRQGKWESSETAKLLLTADPVNINRKNSPMISHRFKMPVFWGTNVAPQFRDSSYAIENRLRIVRCTRVFDAANPVGVAKEANDKMGKSLADYILLTEKAGLLNWFIEGMQRAMKRGRLLETDDMKLAAQEMHHESSRVAGFIEECLEYSSSHMVSSVNLHAAYRQWWSHTRGDGKSALPSPNTLMKELMEASPCILATRKITAGNAAGIMLNEAGKAMWTEFSNLISQSNSKADYGLDTPNAEEVNKTIPEEWLSKAPFKRMLEAHAAKKEK